MLYHYSVILVHHSVTQLLNNGFAVLHRADKHFWISKPVFEIPLNGSDSFAFLLHKGMLRVQSKTI